MSGNAVADIIRDIIQQQRALHPERAVLIGVAGAQGSGKTYGCRQVQATHPGVAHFSMDDVYLTKAERVWRADNISSFNAVRDEDGNFEITHVPRPDVERLLLTRGPPGTHDLALAKDVIAGLNKPVSTKLPRFDKAADERAPESTWPVFQGPAEVILVDGWCLGATPTPPGEPINDVEREDTDGIWRRETQTQLRKVYAQFFAMFDAIVFLQAPNWEVVRRWRGEQEEQLLGRALTDEEGSGLDRFLMHYERITRSMMAGGHMATCAVLLDEKRRAVSVTGLV
jgi:D-glycerate 3-kinase